MLNSVGCTTWKGQHQRWPLGLGWGILCTTYGQGTGKLGFATLIQLLESHASAKPTSSMTFPAYTTLIVVANSKISNALYHHYT
jgi:hypothetical protein